MKQKSLPAAIAVVLGAAALTLSPASSGPAFAAHSTSGDDAAFGARVRAYLLAHPEVIEQAIAELQAREEAQKIADAGLEIAKHRQALEHDPRDGVAGDPNGAVTVVEFFDYRCPFCKAAEPAVEKLLKTRHDIRLVLKEFPILDIEDQTHISEDAARAALGALAQGKYLQVHNALFAYRHLDEAGIKAVLAATGVDATQDATVAQSKAVTDQLADTHQLARDLGIDGTPAFVVGDTMIAGADMDKLNAAIAKAAKANAKR